MPMVRSISSGTPTKRYPNLSLAMSPAALLRTASPSGPGGSQF
jgi:hypothetical protein